jgi:ATP-dependent RNA helicase RhlE
MYFDELDLNDNVLDALYDMHFDDCTPIQEKCIPEILKGKDLLGIAQTGTGKTAAYLLPILSMLDDGGYPKNAINCIIMSPTRELAQQIDQAMQGFSYYLEGVSSVAIYGGNDGNRYDQEIKSLRLGADVVIATPGRFISHITMGNVDMSKVSFFVLDEADRMLDMGFSEDILSIAKKLPPTCQTVMFSATMPSKIEKLAQSLLKDPVKIKLAVSKPAEKIQQSAYVCYEPQKLGIIRDLFKSNSLKRVIIFSGKKDKVKDISRQLRRMHINAGEMHSDLSQAERDETMYRFKSEQIDVLVATDIVARGIDIDDIAMVINYDVPHDVEDYVHRIGRTARADKDGIAITFVNDNDIYYFMQIEQFLEKTITKNPLPQELGDGPQYVSHGKPRNGSNGRGHGNGTSGGKGRGRGHGNGGHGQKSRGNNSSSSTNKSADHRSQQHRRKPTEGNSK